MSTPLDSYLYKQLKGGIGLFCLPSFEKMEWLDHGFTARTGGVSDGFLTSLNLSFSRNFEPRERTMQNYRLLCDAAGFPEDSMVMDTYEHGTTVRLVTREDCGAGYTKESLPFCDGLITDDPKVTLMTGHADCMAFFFADPAHHAIGLAHAGWRGALKRIGCEVVRSMVSAFGSDPRDIIAGVGPSICPACFEVGLDVAEMFTTAFPDINIEKTGKPGKAYIDLWQVARKQFEEAGLLPEHISVMGVCTVEDSRLFSHRGDKGLTGGMSAFMRILSD